jgi:hypothetical protein
MDPYIYKNAYKYIKLLYKHVRPFSRLLLLYLKPVYASVSVNVPNNRFENVGNKKQAEIIEWAWV